MRGLLAIALAAGGVSGVALAQPGASGSPAGARVPLPTADPVAAFENRPIREVRLTGLRRVEEQLVLNQTRSRPGQPLLAETVRGDVARLNRLARFREINAQVEPQADGSVVLEYRFVETPIIEAVDVVGNRQISNQDIAAEIDLLRNTPVDPFQLDRARRNIENLYRRRGYYLVEVSVDQTELEETGTILFRIRERDRVRVTDLRFQGNEAFRDAQLRPEVRTRVAGIFERGPLDNDVLDQDVGRIIAFYRDRGYLDVRADRQITLSPDGREAIVTFLIDEGRVYTLRSVRVETDDGRGRPSGEPPRVFSPEQIRGLMEIKTGDVYSINRLDRSLSAVSDAYGKMGFIDARVARLELRDPEEPLVDLLLLIIEGERSFTGLVTITGNDLTQQKVIRERTTVRPERPLDSTELRQTRQRLEEGNLFERDRIRVVAQAPDPVATGSPDTRDVLIEVRETNTGSFQFGVGVTSDAGIIGGISLQQRNFDIADVPDSLGELFRGRAFRGAGQTFNLTLAPGTEVQEYSLSVADPRLFGTSYTGSIGGFYRQREFRQYDERRFGGQLGFGRRFGEQWTATVPIRVAQIELSDIDADAPVDVFAVEDPNLLTGIGLRLTRTTTDSRFRPTRGARTEFGVERVGLLGGDFDFTKLSFEHIIFLPVYEDFVGRTTVFSLKTSINYIPEDVSETPVYERYYLGGRDFRGFSFRTISPKGIRNDTGTLGDDPVGGTWSFFAGAEIEQPLWDRMITGVVFVDSGTVTNDPGFDDYRVSAGLGLRLYVPQLGPVPLAFDFGFPLLRQDGDRKRLFSFSIDLPY